MSVKDEMLRQLTSIKPERSPLGPCKVPWKKPVVAAIEGACVAGGLELALCADLRVGSADSYYGVYNRRFGIPLVDGGTYRLPKVIGQGHANDMILTGRRVDAAEAKTIGLINRVAEPGNTIERALDLANEIITGPLIPMLNDRQAVYKNLGAKNAQEAVENEFEKAPESLKSAFKSKSAMRFSIGQGRHGSK